MKEKGNRNGGAYPLPKSIY